MIAYYMDENVPLAVTLGLRDREVNALTVQEDGRDGDDDEQLLDRATELKRILVTMDRDFFAIAADRQARSIPFCGVIFASESLSYRERIDDLEMIAKCSDLTDWENQLVILPLTSKG
jgi:predicted nuclease of predicted toxin-antitoxin system